MSYLLNITNTTLPFQDITIECILHVTKCIFVTFSDPIIHFRCKWGLTNCRYLTGDSNDCFLSEWKCITDLLGVLTMIKKKSLTKLTIIYKFKIVIFHKWLHPWSQKLIKVGGKFLNQPCKIFIIYSFLFFLPFHVFFFTALCNIGLKSAVFNKRV